MLAKSMFKTKKEDCPCINCRETCVDFQKVMDIKEYGLTLYRYVRRSCTDEDFSSTAKPYDFFILRSTNANALAGSEFVPILAQQHIKCLRCREIAKRAQKLLKNIPTIEAQSLRGICDHCITQQSDCCIECRQVVKKFIASRYEEEALSKQTNKPKPNYRSSSLAIIEKNIQDISLPLKRDIKVEQLIGTSTDIGMYTTDSTESQKISNRSSIESIEIDDKMNKNVKFGSTSEIKKSLLDTFAEMDDGLVWLVIRDLINSLKEKQDEDGHPLPHSKFIAEKNDEELEQLVLDAIKSGDKDMELIILELIDARETANKHFFDIRKRLDQKYFKPEDIDSSEIKYTVSKSQILEPQQKVVKARGSLEKVIQKEIILEENQLKNKAREVASLIRKGELDRYIKKVRKVMAGQTVEDDERTNKLLKLIKKKLEEGKAEATETKKDFFPKAHSLFRQKIKSAESINLPYDKDISHKAPAPANLISILKGAKKKPISERSESFIRKKSQFQYDFFQKPVKKKPFIEKTSSELITMIKERDERIKTTKTLLKKTKKTVHKSENKEVTEIIKDTDVEYKEAKLSKEEEKYYAKKLLERDKILSQKSEGTQTEHKKVESTEQYSKVEIKERDSLLEDKLRTLVKGRKDSDMTILTKKLEKVLTTHDKDKKLHLKMKERLNKKEHEYRSKASKAMEAHLDVETSRGHLPTIITAEKRKSLTGVITEERTGEKFVELPFKKIRLKGPSIDDLILRLVKTRLSKYPKKMEGAKNILLQKIIEKRNARSKIHDDNEMKTFSDFELDLESLLAERSDVDVGMIVGNEVLNAAETADYISSKEKQTELLPSVFKTVFEVTEHLPTLPYLILPEEIKPKHKTSEESSQVFENAAIIRYQLSNEACINNGWTQLPTQKVFRKLNVYRMYPTRTEFNWFMRKNGKGYQYYDSGELLASMDLDGHGRWFYKNGRIALDFYETEDLNAKQRTVIYSSGEPDRGRPVPVTILGSFDYCGNGAVLDHTGNIRMKYNQTEGVLLDKKIGPETHWKWHALNDPPTYERLWVEPKEKHPDPNIQKLCIHNEEEEKRPDNTDMERTAVEIENSTQEQRQAKHLEFKPFSIRMKTLKLNDNFTIKVVDQANIYVTFRDGTKKLKLNLGLMLDPTEIVDIDMLEVKPGQHFECYLERFPPLTESIDNMQDRLDKTKRFEKARVRREHRLRRRIPVDPGEQLTAALLSPSRIPRTISQQCAQFPSQCDCNVTI